MQASQQVESHERQQIQTNRRAGIAAPNRLRSSIRRGDVSLLIPAFLAPNRLGDLGHRSSVRGIHPHALADGTDQPLQRPGYLCLGLGYRHRWWVCSGNCRLRSLASGQHCLVSSQAPLCALNPLNRLNQLNRPSRFVLS